MLGSPTNSQAQFAPSSCSFNLHSKFAANLQCESMCVEVGELKLDSLRIFVPSPPISYNKARSRCVFNPIAEQDCCDCCLLERVPLILPVVDKVAVAPSRVVLRGVPKHFGWDLRRRMKT